MRRKSPNDSLESEIISSETESFDVVQRFKKFQWLFLSVNRREAWNAGKLRGHQRARRRMHRKIKLIKVATFKTVTYRFQVVSYRSEGTCVTRAPVVSDAIIFSFSLANVKQCETIDSTTAPGYFRCQVHRVRAQLGVTSNWPQTKLNRSAENKLLFLRAQVSTFLRLYIFINLHTHRYTHKYTHTHTHTHAHMLTTIHHQRIIQISLKISVTHRNVPLISWNSTASSLRARS